MLLFLYFTTATHKSILCRMVPNGQARIDAYRNIDLIPVLRQYVAEEIRKNPEKYRVE